MHLIGRMYLSIVSLKNTKSKVLGYEFDNVLSYWMHGKNSLITGSESGRFRRNGIYEYQAHLHDVASQIF